MDQQQGYQQQGMSYQPQYSEKGTMPAPQGSTWSSGFWDCFSPGKLCFMACCCPCFVFGKTQSRNNGEPVPSSVGGNCIGWYCLACCGFQWVFQTVKRNEYRHKHGIEGSGAMDCLGAFCCPCCGLMQEEKESLLREGANNMGAMPQQALQQSPGMPPQGYQPSPSMPPQAYQQSPSMPQQAYQQSPNMKH